MLTMNMQFAKELMKIIEAEKSRVIELIQYGNLENFEAYKRYCGQLEGIRFVVETAFPEAEKICIER